MFSTISSQSRTLDGRKKAPVKIKAPLKLTHTETRTTTKTKTRSMWVQPAGVSWIRRTTDRTAEEEVEENQIHNPLLVRHQQAQTAGPRGDLPKNEKLIYTKPASQRSAEMDGGKSCSRSQTGRAQRRYATTDCEQSASWKGSDFRPGSEPCVAETTFDFIW